MLTGQRHFQFDETVAAIFDKPKVVSIVDLILIPVDSGTFSLEGINPLLEAVTEIKDDETNYLILRNAVINEFIEEELEITKDKCYL